MKKEIENALEAIRKGRLVLFPSESGWMLVTDFKNPESLQRLRSAGIAGENLALLVDIPDKISLYVKEVPPMTWDLLEYAENHLTLILPGGRNVPEEMLDADKYLAVQLIKNTFGSELIRRHRLPLASVAAFPPEELHAALSREDYIVDLPAHNKAHLPAVIRLEVNGQLVIIRK